VKHPYHASNLPAFVGRSTANTVVHLAAHNVLWREWCPLPVLVLQQLRFAYRSNGLEHRDRFRLTGRQRAPLYLTSISSTLLAGMLAVRIRFIPHHTKIVDMMDAF